MKNVSPTAVQAFGAFAANLNDHDLPRLVREKAVTCLVYNIGLARASRDRPGTQQIANDVALAAYGRVDAGGATLFLSGAKTSAAGAAFGNAVLFGAGGRGDTLGTIHAGQMVTAALLALMEAFALPPDRLLPALVAGYEVGGRLDRAYGEAGAQWGFRSTPLFGAPAVAAAAARMLGLDARQTSSAIAFACCTTGGLLQPFEDGSEEPAMQASSAAQLGLMAALAAQRGFTGAAHALEGRFGLVRATARRDVDLEQLTGTLGRTWMIEQVTYKPFPVCAFAQTPVYAGLALREKLAGAQVRELTIWLHPREAAYAGLNFTGPFTSPMERLMSAPFAVVYGLVHGKAVNLSALTGRDDAPIAEILCNTRLEGNAKVPPLCTVLEAALVDGRTIRHEQMMTDADYSLPFDDVCAMVRNSLREVADAAAALEGFEVFRHAVRRGLTPPDVAAFFNGAAPLRAVARA